MLAGGGRRQWRKRPQKGREGRPRILRWEEAGCGGPCALFCTLGQLGWWWWWWWLQEVGVGWALWGVRLQMLPQQLLLLPRRPQQLPPPAAYTAKPPLRGQDAQRGQRRWHSALLLPLLGR